MTDYEFIKSELGKVDVAGLRVLAARKELPFQTLYNIREGITKSPRIDTVERIAKRLRETS